MLASRRCRPYAFVVRYTSTTPESKSIHPPNPKKIATDMIGPPDPVSNLRKVIFKEIPNESDLEQKHRLFRAEVQVWNQKFWSQHNSRFFQEREDYIRKNVPMDRQSLTADEMSVFYKAFLDKNWKSHLKYNIEWYKKNITLLSLAIQVKLSKLFRLKGSK